MSKPLYIAELQIGGNGVRTLAPQKIKLHLKEGALVINGKSGTGKTTLQEVIRLVTQGTSAKRDSNLLKNGEEETEFRVKIAELKNPNGAGFYIRSRVKNTGEVINTFQIDFDGKQKNTDVPIDGLGKMTVSKLQNLMSTTLTYGIDDFLSEDAIRVRQFIFDTFHDELEKLGLVIKKGETGYEDSIAGRIEKAIAERDDIQREQSKLGAYGVNLEGLVQPEFIPMEQFNSRRDAILQEIADAKATDVQMPCAGVTGVGVVGSSFYDREHNHGEEQLSTRSCESNCCQLSRPSDLDGPDSRTPSRGRVRRADV